jgi:hypothetical protein
MSRILSERHVTRSFWSTIAPIIAVAAVTACSSAAPTSTGSTTSDQALALSEAKSSAAATRAAAEACFTAFHACKSAPGADVAACKTTLDACLPAEAGPGPHCGPKGGKGPKGDRPDGDDDRDGKHGPKGGPHGPKGGGLEGGAPPPAPDGSGAPDPEDDGPPTADADAAEPPHAKGDHHRGHPDGGADGGKGRPGYCSKVPLPPPAAVQACKAPLDACLAGGSDPKTCFDAHHACVKAAFDAALPAAE